MYLILIVFLIYLNIFNILFEYFNIRKKYEVYFFWPFQHEFNTTTADFAQIVDTHVVYFYFVHIYPFKVFKPF